MTHNTERVVAVVGVLLVLVAGFFLITQTGDDDGGEPSTVSSGDGGITMAPAFTAEQLQAPPAKDWITNGGSLANQRFSPLDQIDTENVADLKGVWMTDLQGSGVAAKYSAEAQPIVHDGTIYVVTGANDVFAVDVETGKVRWRYKAQLPKRITSVCCGWTSRGVALGDGKVYLGRLDGKLVAIDQRTGQESWSTEIESWKDGYTITAAPLYYDGRVYTGISGGEFQARGRLTAVDAKTGKIDWRFFTVPGPGEVGHDTWPQDNDEWKRGGAPIWQTPAVDPELGLLYISTGNASPDDIGHLREGDNLFAASIVAIDAKSGEYKWHFQQVHHDIWDYDSPNPVILFDAEIDGKQVKGLGQANKTGWVYFLDRTNGKPLFGIEEKPVPQDRYQRTAKTQPIPSTPAVVPQKVSDKQYAEIRDLGAKSPETKNLDPVHGELFVPPMRGKMAVVAPGPAGGVNWPPSSYNPETQLMYVCALETSGGYSVGVTDPPGGARGTAPYLGSVWTINGFRPNPGTLAAVDVTTGDIAWKTDWRDACYSGSTTTAGNLVFTGRNNGDLEAYDATDGGDPLWSFQTGAGANNTATVFEHNGEEYVVFYAGGNSLGATSHGDNLWLFGLNGKLDEVQEGGAGSGVQHAGQDESQSTAKDGDPKAGEDVYAENCSVCHGADGGGGNGGPSILQLQGTPADALQQIEKGGGGMPAFESTLTPQQIADVHAYVLRLAGEK
jgi:quinohemoprotein ethanol dehydrogenase